MLAYGNFKIHLTDQTILTITKDTHLKIKLVKLIYNQIETDKSAYSI